VGAMKVNGQTFATVQDGIDALPYPLPAECEGEPCELEFQRTREMNTVRWGPPRAPGREVWEYSEGDDEPHYVRDCTEEEIKEREAAYASAMAEWHRTQGLARTSGPLRDTARVKMTSGVYYEMIGDGKAWFVTARGHER
jgi:hypothetical protein